LGLGLCFFARSVSKKINGLKKLSTIELTNFNIIVEQLKKQWQAEKNFASKMLVTVGGSVLCKTQPIESLRNDGIESRIIVTLPLP